MKKFIAVCLCFIFLSTSIFCGKFNNQAYADPFTAAQIGAVAYAAMSSWGISFTANNATAAGMGDFMANQVEAYVNHAGGSIASVFGGALAMNVAGKLAAGYQMYNGIKDFVSWLRSKFTGNSLSQGEVNGVFFPFNDMTDTSQLGFDFHFYDYQTSSTGISGYGAWETLVEGVRTNGAIARSDFFFTGSYSMSLDGRNVKMIPERIYRSDGRPFYPGMGETIVYSYPNNISTNQLSWNFDNYIEPTIIDPSEQWLGQVGDYQDTNLEQLLGHILEDVEGNNLSVEGEVVPLDPPQPQPTPMPIDPDTPLQDVPWDGLDTNLKDLYDQGLEEIGKIGEAQEAITDAIADQTGVLEGAIADNAGVVSGAIDQAVSDVQNAIGTQTGTISGAIDQAISDVQTAIGEQTVALDESLSATAEGVETIAEALEDEAINWRKFDLRGLFPFCIPFDIYNMLNALDASPIAPRVQIPFIISSLGFRYDFDIDLSIFDSVAAVMRQMELICYGIALAWATSKVIKW